ncbi:glycoside hydrolase family 5 protein [Winogradskya humida]|uniref:Glycoside hydrolase family 5 domain-containing protein n=1 Tax=Winogradskya humida TaxID=113566 RepID=A0ABQ3ZVH7_9ACTN|nr:cellulase family glycosylhydrolase [Actinoplanes humidus]GIE22595.1 hypothetical protein Ahu01nite_056970 [Actinoplanes humidus]
MRISRAAVAVVLVATVLSGCDSSEPSDRGPAKPVHIDGNRFVDVDGQELQLRGFNHSGAEYSCVEGDGFFDTEDGRAPSDKVVAAMGEWHASVVRVPLNEQCWLGLPSVPGKFSGAGYRDQVRTFVDRLNRHGMVAVLDLHRSAPGDGIPREQEPMPDREHSPAFWQSVARDFPAQAVIFDLFNEPFPYAETNSDRAWSCWRDGGCTQTSVNTGGPYVAAGMTELIAAVRGTGSRVPLLAGGIHWAESLTQWLKYRPVDPGNQLAASWHTYSFNEYCTGKDCFRRELDQLTDRVPVFAGEVGPTLTIGADGVDADCPSSAVRKGGFADSTLDWLDDHAAGYAAWSWNPWPDCWALVKDWGGEPTSRWGVGVRRRLAAS